MKRFKNILFVADRERGLDAALERAVRLSQSNAARLTVMDVMPDAGLDSYLRRTYAINLNAQLREVCTGTGAWISMLGVAGGLVSCGVVGSCAVLVNTVTAWMVAIVTLLVVSGMYWLASGLALAGCSGV